jgi:hypothetical protein
MYVGALIFSVERAIDDGREQADLNLWCLEELYSFITQIWSPIRAHTKNSGSCGAPWEREAHRGQMPRCGVKFFTNESSIDVKQG